jgi:hypothetical protein
MSELMHESEHPWEGACLLTSEGEQIVVLAADCPVCRAERSDARVKELEEAVRGVVDILCSFEEIDGAEKEIIFARAALLGEEQGK